MSDVEGRRARRDAAIEAHRAAADAQVAEAPVVEPVMVGYDETLPHQEEVPAGSAEHVQLLNSYPNASSYGPDVNVVIVDVPPGGGDPQMAQESAVAAEEQRYGR